MLLSNFIAASHPAGTADTSASLRARPRNPSSEKTGRVVRVRLWGDPQLGAVRHEPKLTNRPGPGGGVGRGSATFCQYRQAVAKSSAVDGPEI